MSVQVMTATEPVHVRSLTSDLYNLFVTPNQSSPVSTPSSMPRPASTGCTAAGVTPTVFVFSNLEGDMARFTKALNSAQTMIDVANKLGNDVHVVFVACAATTGIQNFEVAEELLKMKRSGDALRGIKAGNVHLVVGPEEMMMLPIAKGTMLDYLKETKVIHVVHPPDSTQSMWVKATPFGKDIVGKLPGIAVLEANGPRAAWIEPPVEIGQDEWVQEVNRRWQSATYDPAKLEAEDADHFHFWTALAQTEFSAHHDSSSPLEGLDATLGAFACGPAPFAVIQRTFTAESGGKLRTDKTWLCGGASNLGVHWAVKTWCSGFAGAARKRDYHVLDRTVDIGELQYIVNVTLSSLMRHSERDDLLRSKPLPFSDLSAMTGILGPVWEGKRVSSWTTHEGRKVVVLLPEQYVRFVLQDLYSDVLDMQSAGHEAVGGILFLDDESEIPLRAPDLTAPEQRDFATSIGPRLFRIAKPGSREVRTISTSADPLAGMRVVWTFAAGRDTPTLAPEHRSQPVSCSV